MIFSEVQAWIASIYQYRSNRESEFPVMRTKKDSRRGRSVKLFGCLTPSGKVQSVNPCVHSEVARGV